MVKNRQFDGDGADRRAKPIADATGVFDSRDLPDADFNALWESIVVPAKLREQLLSQAVLNFTLRPKVQRAKIPLHGVILLVGPPGTGKTSLARGLASRTAESLKSIGQFAFVEVDPHALASSSLGRSQKAVQELLGQTVAELASRQPLIVLLDEVEALAADRTRMSMEANPIDVHRATDAVLAQLDHLAESHSNLLFIATSNFPDAIDQAFVSRADLIATVGLPDVEGCKTILADTLNELARLFPKVASFVNDATLTTLAKLCVGLDGRSVRKAVVSACALDKSTALDINRLSFEHLERAVSETQQARPKQQST